MKQRFLLIMVMVLAGLVALPASNAQIEAQEGSSDAEWEMVFFVQSPNIYAFQGLLIINPDMTYETITSDEIYVFGDEHYDQFAVSPDKQYFAHVKSGNLAFTDMTQDLAYLVLYPEIPVTYTDIYFKSVAFSPDSQQYVASFRYKVLNEDDNEDEFGGIMIADLPPPGTIVETFISEQDSDRWYADELSWEDEGIYLQWDSFRYEPPLSWYDKLWVPGNPEFQRTNRFHSYYSASLPLTNELLTIDYDLNYPHPDIGFAEHSGNLITYYADIEDYINEDTQQPQFVYWDSIDHVAGQPIWVMDGAGFIVTDADVQTLVLRDGTQIPIERPVYSNRGEFKVWGTPTGWLMHHSDNNMLTSYTYSPETDIVAHDLIQISSVLHLIRTPQLGNASTGEFATIPSYDEIEATTQNGNLSETMHCEGFLPSRLVIGETARVTPGDANNLRSKSSSDSEIIGQIPGGASFTVLDGPVCGENSAWWQVEYQGITGWTAEGQGDDYWLEP